MLLIYEFVKCFRTGCKSQSGEPSPCFKKQAPPEVPVKFNYETYEPSLCSVLEHENRPHDHFLFDALSSLITTVVNGSSVSVSFVNLKPDFLDTGVFPASSLSTRTFPLEKSRSPNVNVRAFVSAFTKT